MEDQRQVSFPRQFHHGRIEGTGAFGLAVGADFHAIDFVLRHAAKTVGNHRHERRADEACIGPVLEAHGLRMNAGGFPLLRIEFGHAVIGDLLVFQEIGKPGAVGGVAVKVEAGFPRHAFAKRFIDGEKLRIP